MPSDTAPTPSFSTTRRWIVGVNVVFTILAALALVIMANYLAARHFTRSQWTTENPNQLSPLTLNFLRSITNQIRVVVFFNKQDALGAYSAVSALLNEYQLACPKLQVEYVDYVRYPSMGLLIRERYKNAFPGEEDSFFKNIVIFDNNTRVKAVYEKELYDMDLSELVSGKSREVKRSAFKGELLFTSALLNVLDPKQTKVCVVQDHREHLLKDDEEMMGYSKFGAMLQFLNLEVIPLALSSQEIPNDCQLLIIPGPLTPYGTEEVNRIDKFLNRGGRLFVLFSYSTAAANMGLESLLSAWGIQVGANAIINNQSVSTTPDRLTTSGNIIVTNYTSPSHPITKPLLKYRLHMLLPRSIDKKNLGRQDADTAKVDELVAAGPDCIATTDVLAPNPAQDRQGLIPVIAAVEKGSIQGLSTERGVTRLVVAGDSFFLGNLLLDTASNRDFASIAINWLLDRSKLMGGIGPRPVKEFNVLMTPSQMFTVRWILLAGLPGAVLGLGFIVWFRRRA